MTEIKQRLILWGAWQRSIRLPRMGYPSADLAHKSVFAGQKPAEIDSTDAEALDRLIVALNKPWPWVLEDYYVKQQTMATIGKKFGRSSASICSWLDKAEKALEQSLANLNEKA